MRSRLLGILLLIGACGGGAQSTQSPETAPLPGDQPTPVAHEPGPAGGAGEATPGGLASKAPAVSEDRCRATLNHVYDLVLTAVPTEHRAEAEQSRAKAVEDMVGECMRGGTPAMLDCLDAAKSPDELQRCQPPAGGE